MPLMPVCEAPAELLTLFHTEKESILARYHEPDPGLFIAESAKVTIRASEAGYEIAAMLIDEAQINREAEELFRRFRSTPAYHAPTQQFLEISGYPMTRGVLSLFRRKRPERASLQDERSFIRDLSDNPAVRRIAVLDHVGNPANIGSIFRNAAALAIDAVLLTKGCCDPLSRRCLRVSMGCVFQVRWFRTGMTGEAIASLLRQQKIRCAALALSQHSVSITSASLKETPRLALFLGNEGNGLPEETIHACDDVVRIPMNENVDSLNVAAASAIAFWELR